MIISTTGFIVDVTFTVTCSVHMFSRGGGLFSSCVDAFHFLGWVINHPN